MALKLGATEVASSEGDDLEQLILDHTSGRGADITFETVGGTSATLSQSMKVTRRRGKCSNTWCVLR